MVARCVPACGALTQQVHSGRVGPRTVGFHLDDLWSHVLGFLKAPWSLTGCLSSNERIALAA